MKKNILLIASAIIFASCNNSANNSTNDTTNKTQEKEATLKTELNPGVNDVMASFNLTVAEGKRLIAKGIASHPLVKKKMVSGMVIITKGSTNTYIAEELIGLAEDHGRFVSGNISNNPFPVETNKIPEIIIENGKRIEMPIMEALKALKEGDIIFKGANLLNYEKKQAAVVVGGVDGGTMGRVQPYSVEGPGHLIVPVGLEKEVHGDLNGYAKVMSSDIKKDGPIPMLMLHKNAEIFTEIEAIKLFGNVKVVLFASGGINGSEGGKSFAVYGPPAEVEKVMNNISTIKGEPPFINQ